MFKLRRRTITYLYLQKIDLIRIVEWKAYDFFK